MEADGHSRVHKESDPTTPMGILTSDLDLALPSPKIGSEHDLTEISKSDHVKTYILLTLRIVMEKKIGTAE